MEKTRFFSYFGREALNGGLNVSDNPLIVGPAEMTEANNISIAQSLARKKRPGLVNYTTTTYEGTGSYPAQNVPIRGFIQYWRFLSFTGVADDDIFLHSENKVWSIANRNAPGIDRSNGFNFSSDSIPSYQVFEGILYFCSTDPGNDGYKKWNGREIVPGDVEDAVGPADGDPKFLSTFKAQMMAAGVVDFPFRLYVSEALDAEDWTNTSFDIDYDGDPEGITALFGEYQGRFYFATSRSIYELDWPDPSDVATAQINRISKGIGCVGHRLWVQTPNDVLFWSYRGLHSLRKTITSNQTEFEFLSRPIQKLVTEQLNFEILTQGQSVWDKTQNLVITTVPSDGQTTNDVILVYNITFNLWTVWMQVNARSIAEVLLNKRESIGVGTELGKLALFDNNIQTDFDEGFAANFKTAKLFPGGDIINENRFLSCTILASATTVSDITVEWSVDGKDGTKSGSKVLQLADEVSLLGSTFILGQSTLGIGRFVPYRFTIDTYGYNIQLNISCSGESDIEFYGYILEVEDANQVYI